MKTRLLHFLLPMAFLAAAQGGTHVWSGAGANTSWSNPANWSSGGVPTAVEAAPVKLVFPSNATGFTSTPNINNLKVDAIEVDVTGVNYSFTTAGIPLTLTGAAGDNFKITGTSGNATWQPALSLQATCRVNVLNSGTMLDFQGVVAGSGGITKTGLGAMKFSTGSAANTFTGTLRLESGHLVLAKIVGTPCFSGKFEMVSGNCAIERSHQIPDTSAVEMWSGLFAVSPGVGVSSVSETLGNITFRGSSTIRAYSNAAITISGALACADEAGITGTVSAFGTGSISLGGGVKTISVPNASSHIAIDASIGNGATATGMLKTGAGGLRLGMANSFTGPVEVQGGTLHLFDGASLGTGAGSTTVREGAILNLAAAINLPAGEKIHLEGSLHSSSNVEIAGEVVLGGTPQIRGASGKTFRMSGVISGSASELLIDQGGTVEWYGAQANTYSAITKLSASVTLVLNKSSGNAMPGPVQFSGGTLSLAASNQIADSAPVWFSSSGVLKLNGHSDTVLHAYGTVQGRIELGSGSLTLAGNNWVSLGSQAAKFRITGTASSSIHKKGSGKLTIHRSEEPEDGNELTALHIESGGVSLNGYWQGPVHVAGSTLEGTAKTGLITSQGATINLSSMQTKGVNTLDAGGTLLCLLSSEVPGTGFGMMDVTGEINLTGMDLDLSVNYLPMNGSTYTILKNDGTDPVVGIFNGLPEGAVFSVNGRPFRITYKAGPGGNDVMIRFIGTGTPGPEITAVVLQADGSVRVDMEWEPGKAVKLERAVGAGLEQWSTEGTFTMDAQGKAVYSKQLYSPESAFFRLRTNPQ
jgi:fibronectin-binding autotransporter adhesin